MIEEHIHQCFERCNERDSDDMFLKTRAWLCSSKHGQTLVFVRARRLRHRSFVSFISSPSLQIRDDSSSNLEDFQLSFRNRPRNHSEFFDTRTDSPGAQIFPVVSWAYMRTMENRVLIYVNSFLGKHRDRIFRNHEGIAALSNILQACSRHIELLLEVQ